MTEKPKTQPSSPSTPIGPAEKTAAEKLVSLNCQIREVRKWEYRLTCRGAELAYPINSLENAINMRNIAERAIVLRESCDRQQGLLSFIKSCEIERRDTVLGGMSLRMGGLLGETIINETQFVTALERTVRGRPLQTEAWAVYAAMEPLLNFVNRITRWDAVASQLASNQ